MIYILIPLYNEENNIRNLFNELCSVLKGEEKMYVFSDDGSTDKTVEFINRDFRNSKFIILGDGANHGPGHAFNTGFEWIVEHASSGDRVITMEADCTSDIGIMENMVAISGLGYDLVLASVYSQGGGFENTNLFRKLLSTVANLIFRFVFDLHVLTLSSFYRVYRIEVLQRIKKEFDTFTSENGFICMLEILLKSIKVGARVIEVPMRLNSSKRQGKSKMKIFGTAFQYLSFIVRFKYARRSK